MQDRWTEFISEQLVGPRKDYNIMKSNFGSPCIMKDEIQAAIRKMKSVKAIGPVRIAVEL